MTAIRTEGLSKRYGETLALDALDLEVQPGEVYGYLGPNGSGKTTTIRLLLGLHRPSAGRGFLFGIDAWHDPVEAHRRVAYVAGEPFLWPSLTSTETFAFLARLHGSTDTAYRDELVERFQLDVSKKVRALSKGNRQKVQLVAAFATRADLLLLDEPSSGLDPLMEVAFRQTVLEAKERGQTVFLSSHILSEVEALCDRVGILRRGRLVDEGTLAELRHLGAQTVEVDVRRPAAGARPLPGVHVVHAGANALRFEVTGSIGPLIDALAHHEVVALTSREPSLEEIFLHHYDGERRPCRTSSARSRGGRSPTRASGRSRSRSCSRLSRPPTPSATGRRTRRSPTGSASCTPSARTRASASSTASRTTSSRSAATWPGASAAPLSIFAAVWGLLAAVRAMRTEEDAGRQELVLAGVIGRGGAFVAALVAIGVGAAVLWLATFVGLVAARLPAGGSAYLALAVVAVVPVFVGVGALASQLAPNRRIALELGSGALAAAFLLRVVADTSSLTALRWATPLGWIEELRAFAGPRPVVLLLPLASSVLLLGLAALIALRRDVGSGLLQATGRRRRRDSACSGRPPPRPCAPSAAASLAWLLATGAFAFVLGVIADSISSAGLSKRVQEQLAKLGASAIATPAGYLGFTFLFFILAVSLFCCSQIAAARREEADQQLETLLALPVGRRRLARRPAPARRRASRSLLALLAGLLAWAGAASQGAAGLRSPTCSRRAPTASPPPCSSSGSARSRSRTLPRAATGIAYGLTSLAFVWELFGPLVGAPAWSLGLSPFHHIGLIPAEPFRATAAVVMLAIAAGAALAALWAFGRRDLTGA